MKRTIILSPYKKDISGTAELMGNSIKLTINHPAYPTEAFFNLYALSTSKAASAPYMLGRYCADGTSIQINEKISAEALKMSGYNIENIDTYLITISSSSCEEPAAAAFFGLEWNAARFLTSPINVHEKNEELPTADTTIENAKKLLSSLKSGKRISEEKINKYIADFTKNIQSYNECTDIDDTEFVWYKITSQKPISTLSSVRHILSSKSALCGITASGHYIAGIKKTNNRHIAIGIPGCRHICPMPQLSDCCSYSGGYHIAGIYLGEDGQYFEKYLQND